VVAAGTPNADVPAKINQGGPWLKQATPDECRRLVEACLWSEAGSAGLAMGQLYFTKGWRELAGVAPSLWKRAAPDAIKAHAALRKVVFSLFQIDTQQVALGYLDQNRSYCVDTLAELGLDPAGKRPVGPPTPQQVQARQEAAPTEVVADLVKVQQGLQSLRKKEVGKRSKMVKTGGGFDVAETSVYFSPEPEPTDLSTKGPNDWRELKKTYDQGKEAIVAVLGLYPALYVLVRESVEDTSKTDVVAKDASSDRGATADVMGTALVGTMANIDKTRPMLDNYSNVLVDELTPIHQQLQTGTSGGPRRPGRDWAKDPVYAAVVDAWTADHAPKPWWQTLGLAALEMGVYVVAGLATGGVGFAAAMLAKSAAELAMAAGKAQVMNAAAGTGTSANTELLSQKQAAEADSEVKMAAFFVALDAIGLGVEIRGAARAAKLAAMPAGKALEATERSAKVLQMERELLGRPTAEAAREGAELVAEQAKTVRRLADELAASAKGASGAGRAELEAQARLANHAADRAKAVADRVKDRADKLALLGVPGRSVAESTLTQELTIVLDGTKYVVTKTGRVYVCASPCWALTEKWAALISRHPDLLERAVALRRAEEAAAEAATKGGSRLDAAVQKRLALMAKSLEEECKRYRQAQDVLAWLRTAGNEHPLAARLNLDEGAVSRILAKKNLDGAKGQLMEEIAHSRVMELLRTEAGRVQLAGKHAKEQLEFIPGRMLRDGEGRQLTDGIIGFRKKDGSFKIVAVVEVKSGPLAAQGLLLGKTEVGAIQSTRGRLARGLFAQGKADEAKSLLRMDLHDFMRVHAADIQETVRRAEQQGDWGKQALETVQQAHVQELRAANKGKLADEVSRMGTSAYGAKFPDRAKAAKDLVPLPEAGQFTSDLERIETFGVAKLDPSKVPDVIDGKVLGPQWKGKAVPPGTWQDMDTVGGRGSVQSVGFVPSDVPAGRIGQGIADAGLKGGAESLGGSAQEIAALAQAILKRAESASKTP